MDDLLSLFQPEPWSPFTAGLIAAMFLARGLDFLSTWIVTSKLVFKTEVLRRLLGKGE